MSGFHTSNNFFEAGSPFLDHPLLTAARTAQEIDFIEAELALPPGARLLDVGCGFGRHTVELARRGYNVLGIDPAAAMIAAAQKRAAAAAVSPQFRQERGEQFQTEASFDAAICLFTSLGQITEQGENNRLVPQIYAALKSSGQFVVEVPQRDTAVRQLKLNDKFGSGERYTAVTRQYNPADQTVTERFRLVSPAETRTYSLRYRLYSRTELVTLLSEAGFKIQAAYGNYEMAPLTNEQAMMLIIGRKE